MPERPKVIATRRFPPETEARLEQLFGAEINRSGKGLTRAALAEAMRRADVLACSVGDRIDAALLDEAGERVKLIANFGVGVDHIDVAAARARGIAVTNTPDVLTDDTADIAIALILMVLRRLGEGERVVREGRWGGWKPTDFLGRALRGKKLGIVGMGRIGQATARRAAAFGMEIHYNNRNRLPDAVEAAHGARWWAELDTMLPAVDVLSINAPYGAETHKLIDARRLALMRPDAVLINTARGGLVDEEALIAALESGALAGAGLDVYPNEPHVDPRLIALPNAVLLPHLGSATVESRDAMGEKVIANILAFSEGRPLPDLVA
ncbi:MAG TPA: D-glycerate dehydrogenase [Allosphingosinicella sp.]|jgi:glyoxylate reductase|nr:D-glycerate dehydrogenase [Allosphingosinicella sp.]